MRRSWPNASVDARDVNEAETLAVAEMVENNM
jgi:hypothetical protein